jgi:hypothetical protein
MGIGHCETRWVQEHPRLPLPIHLLQVCGTMYLEFVMDTRKPGVLLVPSVLCRSFSHGMIRSKQTIDRRRSYRFLAFLDTVSQRKLATL